MGDVVDYREDVGLEIVRIRDRLRVLKAERDMWRHTTGMLIEMLDELLEAVGKDLAQHCPASDRVEETYVRWHRVRDRIVTAHKKSIRDDP